MTWKIIVFETSRGEKPVEGFIKSLDGSTIAKVAHEIDLLENMDHIWVCPTLRKSLKSYMS